MLTTLILFSLSFAPTAEPAPQVGLPKGIAGEDAKEAFGIVRLVRIEPATVEPRILYEAIKKKIIEEQLAELTAPKNAAEDTVDDPKELRDHLAKALDRLIREAERRRETPIPTPQEFRREQQLIVEELNRIMRRAEEREEELRKLYAERFCELRRRVRHFCRKVVEAMESAEDFRPLVRRLREIDRELEKQAILYERIRSPRGCRDLNELTNPKQ